MTDEKRFLNNLVGENWAEKDKKTLSHWTQKSKKKKIGKRLDTFEEE